MNCLLCNTEHNRKIIDLGEIYHSIYLTNEQDINQIQAHELAIIECPKCEFKQLSKILEPDSLYREYFYRSDANSSMVSDLKDVYEDIVRHLPKPLNKDDIVIDIGGNVGVLTNMYPKDVTTVIFDPANNLKEKAVKNCSLFINDYFNEHLYTQEFGGTASVISSIACWYDIPNPRQILDGIKILLSQDGLFVIQMTDWTSMLKARAFDNICFEHLMYYTLHQLNNLLEEHEFKIIDVSYNNTNGASIRVFATHKESTLKVHDNVQTYIKAEENFLQEYTSSMFCCDIIKSCNIVTKFIRKASKNNRYTFGLGASTKGSVLMQVFGLTKEDIPYILEINKDKIGKYWSAGLSQIYGESIGWDADYLLVFPWHFKQNLIERFDNYLLNDGSLIFPLPEPVLVNKQGEFPLKDAISKLDL